LKKKQIQQRLEIIFQEIFDDDDIQILPDMTADDIEEWDSVMQITLVITIEKEFGLILNAAEVGQLDNIGDMIDLIFDMTNKAA
jgi:acyl carrier protein